MNCNEWVSLRQAPSTSARRLATVYLGQQVDAYYYNGTFCYCCYNGIWGYILSEYLGNYPY